MSVTPETARQAVKAWNDAWTNLQSESVKGAGDALAVLVPQLLELHDERWARLQWAAEEIKRLESEKAQLLDQLAEHREQRHLAEDLYLLRESERDALEERCRQLEAALRTIASPETRDGLEVARAALGDTPPRPEVRWAEMVREVEGESTLDVAVEPPQCPYCDRYYPSGFGHFCPEVGAVEPQPDPPPAPVVSNDALIDHECRETGQDRG